MRNSKDLKRNLCLGFTALGILLHHPGQTQAADPGLLSPAKKQDGTAKKTLKPGDKLQMLVYRESDLTSNVTVDKGGLIVLPLIGEIKVGGMTVREARTHITDLYNRDYLVNPQVILTPDYDEEDRGRITVMGRVGSAGTYSLPKGSKQIPLLEAVALAGGFTRYASESGIKVRRREGGKEKVYTISAKKLAQDPKAQQFFILPGDHITVPERLF